MADSWATAREQALMKYLMDIEKWVDDMRKVWGPDWARVWRDWINQQKQQITANTRQINDHIRQVESQAAKAGYKVTWS
jgi:hypothetical protein